MKYEIKKIQFKPIEVKIILETQDELNEFYNYCCEMDYTPSELCEDLGMLGAAQ